MHHPHHAARPRRRRLSGPARVLVVLAMLLVAAVIYLVATPDKSVTATPATIADPVAQANQVALPTIPPSRCYRTPAVGTLLNPLTGGICVPPESKLERAAAACSGHLDGECYDLAVWEIVLSYPLLTPRIAKRYEEYSQAVSATFEEGP